MLKLARIQKENYIADRIRQEEIRSRNFAKTRVNDQFDSYTADAMDTVPPVIIRLSEGQKDFIDFHLSDIINRIQEPYEEIVTNIYTGTLKFNSIRYDIPRVSESEISPDNWDIPVAYLYKSRDMNMDDAGFGAMKLTKNEHLCVFLAYHSGEKKYREMATLVITCAMMGTIIANLKSVMSGRIGEQVDDLRIQYFADACKNIVDAYEYWQIFGVHSSVKELDVNSDWDVAPSSFFHTWLNSSLKESLRETETKNSFIRVGRQAAKSNREIEKAKAVLKERFGNRSVSGQDILDYIRESHRVQAEASGRRYDPKKDITEADILKSGGISVQSLNQLLDDDDEDNNELEDMITYDGSAHSDDEFSDPLDMIISREKTDSLKNRLRANLYAAARDMLDILLEVASVYGDKISDNLSMAGFEKKIPSEVKKKTISLFVKQFASYTEKDAEKIYTDLTNRIHDPLVGADAVREHSGFSLDDYEQNGGYDLDELSELFMQSFADEESAGSIWGLD